MRRIHKTAEAPADLPLSQAVSVDMKGRLVFASGVVADPITRTVPEQFEDEARMVLDQLVAILAEAGCSKENVLKCTCFLADIKLFHRFNAVYREYFDCEPPARSTFQVGLNDPFRLEVEAIGYMPEQASGSAANEA